MAKPAQIKTKENNASVKDYIEGLKDEQMKQDSFKVLKLMEKLSGEKPKMWGSSMIGFGLKRYKSPTSGREVDWFRIGFAPRKSNLSLHMMLNLKEQEAALKKLGKHKTGMGCLYISKLDEIDLKVLESLIKTSLKNK